MLWSVIITGMSMCVVQENGAGTESVD